MARVEERLRQATMGVWMVLGVSGCQDPIDDAATPDAQTVPTEGAGPDVTCVASPPELSAGVTLGSVLPGPVLAPTHEGFVLVGRDENEHVFATFVGPNGEVLAEVDATNEVGLPPEAFEMVVRPDDFLVVWFTEFELGWRALSHEGELGPSVVVPIFPHTVPASAEWYAGGLELVVSRPGDPDRWTRYAADGQVLAGPFDLPLSNRRGGVVDHDPAMARMLHLHTLSPGEHEELWRVPMDPDTGPGEREILYTGRLLFAGDVLRRPAGTLLAFEDTDRGTVLMTVDAVVRESLPNFDRGYPALAEGAGCVALAHQPRGLPGSAGVELHVLDGTLAPQGTWTLLDVSAEAMTGPHRLAWGHGRFALAWTERLADRVVLWFHTWEP